MLLARSRKSAFGHLVSKSLGALLREFRNKAHLSVQQLATESGVDRKYIYQLEKGLSQPTLETVFRLANALAVDCTEIVTGTELLVARASGLGFQKRSRRVTRTDTQCPRCIEAGRSTEQRPGLKIPRSSDPVP